jgi:mannose-6-phosphate isomerase-like protein (cupin superfamily)
MPVYTRETLKADRLPWVDIDDFEFFLLGRGVSPNTTQPAAPGGHAPIWAVPDARSDPPVREITPTFARERVVLLVGEATAESENGRVTLKRGDYLDVPASGLKLRNLSSTSAELLHIAGHWKQSIRTSMFQFHPDKPCDYHYHDSDEYWFVFRGHFTLQYDDRYYPMRPGSMLAAGMGYEHGVLDPEEQFEGVGFATQLEGALRDGHLLRDIHGDPVRNREIPEATLLRGSCASRDARAADQESRRADLGDARPPVAAGVTNE